ncbi:CarD family transcriptional regulator [Thalassobacillus devorans]|uniref:CarD family transcriptional regulator n=1 Tax=Thalassobacillus devorans TaxID=279813 RepID=UPI0004AFB5C7|nr:CarD family transcriptional regulator [Thalassobacillus devorans]
MYNIGELIIYSSHGICRVDDICNKTISGTTKSYYVLHPLEDDHHLTISTPVDNDKVVMLGMMKPEEAKELLESFHNPGIEWNDQSHARFRKYSDIVNSGERKEIVKVVNTLMRKKIEAERQDKKLHEQDRKLLKYVQDILFRELAISLDTTIADIKALVTKEVTAE